MDVLRIDAEVEDVVLRDAHVLDELPDRVLDAGRPCPAFVVGQALDALVEVDVRFSPVEDANEMISKSVVAHGEIMRRSAVN